MIWDVDVKMSYFCVLPSYWKRMSECRLSVSFVLEKKVTMSPFCVLRMQNQNLLSSINAKLAWTSTITNRRLWHPNRDWETNGANRLIFTSPNVFLSLKSFFRTFYKAKKKKTLKQNLTKIKLCVGHHEIERKSF